MTALSSILILGGAAVLGVVIIAGIAIYLAALGEGFKH